LIDHDYRCYTALGVPEDAADSLVIFAYEQQVKTDFIQAPWYLSYFKVINNRRSSEALETKLAVELSEGKFDAEQLTDAYIYFGLSLHSPTSDEHIIGVFQSRLQDARVHELEMREQLRMIGVHRQSKKIIETAEDG
jgi:ubiquitin carboxyl-terminal hydrolase 25